MTGAARVRAPRAEKLRRTLMEAGIEATLLENSELRVRGATSADIGELAFRAGFPLHELTRESTTLEDVFLELTAGETR